MRLDKARKLAEERDIGKYQTTIKSGSNKGKADEKYYVLFVPDYEDMAAKLKMRTKNIRKYFKKFCEIGIMIDMGKMGSRGNKIYAVGSWLFFINEDKKEQGRRKFFLKDSSEMRKKLAAFKL